jgi:anti-sigma regulatory factor (Ser/Thr protein kinase)
MIGTNVSSLTLRIANRLDAIPAAAERIAVFCRQKDVPPVAIGHLNLALDEALTNAFSHAWPDGGKHEAVVSLHVGPDGLQAEVSDDGMAFNPLNAPRPDLDADLDDRIPGGLGVHFIRTLMDSVSYRRDNERNVLTLWKSFSVGRGKAGPADGGAGPDD